MRVVVSDGGFDAFDVSVAAEIVTQAANNLIAVTQLPSAIGSRVLWTNGVIWHRISDNAWLPEHPLFPEGSAEDQNPDRVAVMWAKYKDDEIWWPSSHIANDGYKVLGLPLDEEPYIDSLYPEQRMAVEDTAYRAPETVRFAPREGFSQVEEDYRGS